MSPATKAAKKTARTARKDRIAAEQRVKTKGPLAQQAAALASTPDTDNAALILTGGEIPAGQRGAYLWPAQPAAASAVPTPGSSAAKAAAQSPITDSVVATLHAQQRAGQAVDDSDATDEQRSLAAHFGVHTGSTSLVQAQEAIDKSRIDAADHLLGIEALPVGTIIEHEAPYRWRVKSPPGQPQRFGFGATALEAIQHFILGDTSLDPAVGTPYVADAANVALSNYSEQTRREIQERDQAVANRGANMAAARENLLTQTKDGTTEYAETEKKSGAKKAKR